MKKILLLSITCIPLLLLAQEINLPSFFAIEPAHKNLKKMKVYYTNPIYDAKDFLCYEASYDSAGRFITQQYWQWLKQYKNMDKKVEYVYTSGTCRYYVNTVDTRKEIVYQYLNKENYKDSVLLFENNQLISRMYYSYYSGQVLSYIWISDNDTMAYTLNKYDKNGMFESGTDFLHYFQKIDDYPPSVFKKSVERYGDSLVIKMEHYKENELQSTTYFYKVYKNGKILKEYHPTGNGALNVVGNPVKKIILYTYNKMGLPLTMRENIIEYSKIVYWKMFRAEYEFY